MAGLVNHAHAAAADFLQDFVVADLPWYLGCDGLQWRGRSRLGRRLRMLGTSRRQSLAKATALEDANGRLAVEPVLEAGRGGRGSLAKLGDHDVGRDKTRERGAALRAFTHMSSETIQVGPAESPQREGAKFFRSGMAGWRVGHRAISGQREG